MKNVLKNKKVVISTVAGIALIALIFTAIFVSTQQDKRISLKKDVVVVELGDEVSLDAKDYLDTDDKSILSKTKVSTNAKKVDGIVPVGDYKVDLKYGDELLTQKVQVKDTTSPVFKDPKAKVEVDREFDGDLATNFSAEDLSEVKITIDSKDVDLNKAGSYKAKAIATDKYKNKTEQAFEVVVGEKSKAEKEAEEKEKAEAENKQTETSNNGSQGSTTGNASNGTAGTTGGNNNGTAGTTGGGTQTPVPSNPNVPNACTFIKWNNVGNSGKVFTEYNFWDDNDYELMEIWALNNQPSWSNTFTIYSIDDNCGNVGTTINWETN
ncbi:hypothetical protein EDD63_11653 [Breznakia blatticola]|uniref:Uncharacterized protein n=1 Tax=Breznakia blatticola TaxID=1754012 RepID=A0A4R7ZST2_9FIRM|nr:hypothetical protein [Breznakia blatticola]TDW19951.1 hypothetical protein EDD63_11653 [Breznakia blatticola]